MKINHGIEIHHVGDLPARSGLGSSSSFTVGLLHAVHSLKGNNPTKLQLARQAIHIERDVLKENVGSQDQVAAAFGGFNKISFTGHDQIKIEPVLINPRRLEQLQKHFLLFHTGISRSASDVAKKQIESTPKKQKELSLMSQMVDEAINILSGKRNLLEFGKLLHESWLLKRSLSDIISSNVIDNIYEGARKSGAIGGKILGAGGGGFMLLFVEPENQFQVKKRLTKFHYVPFKFEEQGSTVIFNHV
jgi:D-glycero-alpha-D-manno-heptose-7-phosphate kinase